MKLNNFKRKCQNCGASVTTDICPYCNTFTGIDSNKINMEYPVIECKEAGITFWNFIFPIIVAMFFVPLGISSIVSIFNGTFEGSFDSVIVRLIAIAIGVVYIVVIVTPVIRTFLIMIKGEKITATVYGYMDDNISTDGVPNQIVKLLINTNDGPRFILYQLAGAKHFYKINSKVNLKVYKDIFLIENKNKYHFGYMNKIITKHCSNCGAPVSSEICPYCHVATGIDSRFANMEYPVINCKEAGITLWNFGFLLISAPIFIPFGIITLFVLTRGVDITFNAVCLTISIAYVIVLIIPIIRTLLIMVKGEKITATVYGYMDDDSKDYRMVKLLFNTNDGPRFILYKLYGDNQSFEINSKINLKVYKDIFLIEKKKDNFG